MNKAIPLAAAVVVLGVFPLFALPDIAILDTLIIGDADPGLSLVVTETVSEEFVSSGSARVLDRTTVDESLQEVEFQLSGMADESEMRKAGQLVGSRLGADYVVILQLSELGGGYYITGKLIDIRTGEIVAQESVESDDRLRRIKSAVVKLSEGLIIEGLSDPWMGLVGDWTITRRPEGWLDTMYSFTDDGLLIIYNSGYSESDIAFKGRIVSVEGGIVTARTIQWRYSDDPEMLLYYRFVDGQDVIEVGWENVFYLTAERR